MCLLYVLRTIHIPFRVGHTYAMKLLRQWILVARVCGIETTKRSGDMRERKIG